MYRMFSLRNILSKFSAIIWRESLKTGYGNTPKTNCGQYVILFMRGYVTTSDKEAAPRAMLETDGKSRVSVSKSNVAMKQKLQLSFRLNLKISIQ